MGASTNAGDSLRPITATIKFVASDYDFVPTYGVKISCGQEFSRAYGTDTSNFLLNESAVRAIGWKTSEEAIGRILNMGQ